MIMWSYYCKKCEKQLDFEEVELLEIDWEGDWEECCIYCNSQLKVRLDILTKTE